MPAFLVEIIDGGGGDGGDGGDSGGDGDGGGEGGGGGGDDDPPGLSIDDAPAVREGESAAFVVRLSASSGKLVTVAYETMDGTAVAGADYTSTSGTLRFDAGETRQTLAVPTLEDATAEETEGFTVQLSEPSGATVADGTATGTITDDDDPPGLSIDDAPAVREGESAAFVVRLSAASGVAVTVAYRTMDGSDLRLTCRDDVYLALSPMPSGPLRSSETTHSRASGEWWDARGVGTERRL